MSTIRDSAIQISAYPELFVLDRVAGLTVKTAEAIMNGLIYLVGLIVVIMFILSFLGLR